MTARHRQWRSASPLFASYTQLPERVPTRVWTALRCLSVATLLGIVLAGFLAPALALSVFWGLLVPLAPLVFLIVPGFWRNVCPLAALSQIARTAGVTRGRPLPASVQRNAPLVSAGVFFAIVPLRKVLLDQHGAALAGFLLTLMSLAFMGGLFFKGKSGWCSQFCPMLAVERFYGQSPPLLVRDAHCRPCVGCTRNCYDASPTAAYLRDLHNANRRLAMSRKLFAAAMPWFIVAFFVQPPLSTVSALQILVLYGRLLLPVAAGMGLMLVLEAWTPFTSYQLILGHVVTAFNAFYWFIALLALRQFGMTTAVLPHAVHVGVLAISLLWLRRAWPRERAFLTHRMSRTSGGIRHGGAQARPSSMPA
jgi:nitrite reductase (NADH) large subunit